MTQGQEFIRHWTNGRNDGTAFKVDVRCKVTKIKGNHVHYIALDKFEDIHKGRLFGSSTTGGILMLGAVAFMVQHKMITL